MIVSENYNNDEMKVHNLQYLLKSSNRKIFRYTHARVSFQVMELILKTFLVFFQELFPKVLRYFFKFNLFKIKIKLRTIICTAYGFISKIFFCAQFESQYQSFLKNFYVVITVYILVAFFPSFSLSIKLEKTAKYGPYFCAR